MKRLPIITSVESKLHFPGKEIAEDATNSIFSYREVIHSANNKVQFAKTYQEIATTSCVVGLSGYVQIGFSSAENGRMYILKVPLKTAFLATYLECATGCLKMAMAVSLS